MPQEIFEIDPALYAAYQEKMTQMENGRQLVEHIHAKYGNRQNIVVPYNDDPMIPCLSMMYLPQYIKHFNREVIIVTAYQSITMKLMKSLGIKEKVIGIDYLSEEDVEDVIKFMEVLCDVEGICSLALPESLCNEELLAHEELSLDDIVATGILNLPTYQQIDHAEMKHVYRVFAEEHL